MIVLQELVKSVDTPCMAVLNVVVILVAIALIAASITPLLALMPSASPCMKSGIQDWKSVKGP